MAARNEELRGERAARHRRATTECSYGYLSLSLSFSALCASGGECEKLKERVKTSSNHLRIAGAARARSVSIRLFVERASEEDGLLLDREVEEKEEESFSESL